MSNEIGWEEAGVVVVVSVEGVELEVVEERENVVVVVEEEERVVVVAEEGLRKREEGGGDAVDSEVERRLRKE